MQQRTQQQDTKKGMIHDWRLLLPLKRTQSATGHQPQGHIFVTTQSSTTSRTKLIAIADLNKANSHNNCYYHNSPTYRSVGGREHVAAPIPTKKKKGEKKGGKDRETRKKDTSTFSSTPEDALAATSRSTASWSPSMPLALLHAAPHSVFSVAHVSSMAALAPTMNSLRTSRR